VNRIIQDNLNKIKAVCEAHMVQSLYLFGSAATDDAFKETSDIDLLVNYRKNYFEGCADNYFEMIDDLKSVFNRDVDLVIEGSLKNPYLIDSINQTKVLLYG